jgi:hypothetical protein
MLSLAIPGRADTELDFTGQLRVRTEGHRREFTREANTFEFTDLRTRLALRAIYEEYTHIFIQMQDSRRWGGTNL